MRDKDEIDKEYAKYEAQLRSRGSDEQEMTYILNGLERIARNARIKIVNIKPKPPQEKEFYRSYLVEIETESDMHSLMKFIFDVKNSPLLLRIDKLSLSSKSSRTGAVIRASMLISKLSLKQP
jgi:Tfp pilus assembly protein PilO